MDTPDKIIPSSTLSSNFEDSPVFNYISNLSPIKPLKSQISHSFQSLNFAPVPSVFSSPQATSFKEAKCWKRGDFSKTSTVEDTSEKKDDAPTGLLEVKLPDCSADSLGSCEAGPSTSEALLETTNENSSSFLPTLPESFENEYNSPDNKPSRTTKAGLGIETVSSPKLDMCFHKEGIQQVGNTAESDINLHDVYPLGLPEDDWDNLISDNSNLFTFDSSIPAAASRMHEYKLEETSVASFVTKFQVDNVSHQQEVHGSTSSSHRLSWLQDSALYSARLGEPDTANCRPMIFPCRQNVSDNGNMGYDEPVDRIEVTDEASSQSDNKVHNQQLRIMRRRCLVFDAVGVFSKSMEDGLKCNSATTYQSDGALDDKTLGPYKHGVSSSPCMVPGIGLHLNTFATSKNCKVVKQEILSSGKHIITMPRSVTSVSSLTAVQKSITKRLTLSPVEKGISPTSEDIQVTELNVQPSELVAEDDSMQISPTKKRRRMELEDKGCKWCNCKKSKCLKLYCECFAAGVYCVEPCSCIDCYNKPIHEDTVLSTRRQIESRNPLAFAPKVIWRSETLPDMAVEDTNKTPASARHKRGCNCKKSSCNKKYCECFQGGVGCSTSCRCEGCKNSYGVKEGLTLCSIVEVEPEEDELPSLAKEGLEQRLPLKEVQKDDRDLTDTHIMTTTPFSACRTLLKLPLSSRKFPRSSLQSAGPIKKHGTKNSKIKLDDNFADSLEHETPGFLNDSISTFTGVKNLSPTSKRVSPHNHNATLGMSPGMRSSRRLILQSIPSIPPQ